MKANWNEDKNEIPKGFSWEHGSKADTNGILIWSDIFLHEAHGEKIAIALVDTQGLFEPNKHVSENSRIFGLSNLLSSVQIYNLNGEVQEIELEYLEMATEFTKFMASSTIPTSKSVKDVKPFQNLLFLIRDWTDENYKYGYRGGKQYLLQNVLNPNLSSGNHVAQSVRKNIRGSFDNIECFLLPFPGEIVRKKNFNGRCAELNDEFVENLEQLIESIFLPENLIQKRMLNVEVTGEVFRDYIVTYFKAFQSDQLPEFQTLYQMTLYNQMATIIDELLIDYKNNLNQSLDMSADNFEESLEAIHGNAKSATVKKFTETPKMGDEQTELHFANVLKQKLDEMFTEWQIDILKSFIAKAKYEEEIKKLKLSQEEEKRRLDANVKEIEEKLRKELEEKLENEKSERRRAEREALQKDQSNMGYLKEGIHKVVDGVACVVKGSAEALIPLFLNLAFKKFRL